MVRNKKDVQQKEGLWTVSAMQNAVRAVRTTNLSTWKAAQIYRVPRTTLQRRVQGSIPKIAPASRLMEFLDQLDRSNSTVVVRTISR